MVALVLLMSSACAAVASTPRSGSMAASAPPLSDVSSSPPGRQHDAAPARPQDRRRISEEITVVDPVVSNTDPQRAVHDRVGGSEPSIAVNPRNPSEIVMTAFSGENFSGGWPSPAPLWFSSDAGRHWTKEFSIPSPPGHATRFGTCPCDQTVEYGNDGLLYGTFLADASDTQPCGNAAAGQCVVVTGGTTDPRDVNAWRWRGDPVQATNQVHPGSADQPWLVVDAKNALHVAYDDFAGGPSAQVATAAASALPPDFATDTSPGIEVPFAANPGLRLAVDPRGALYALFQRSEGLGNPKTVSYVLNRSTDGGRTWNLNGASDGVVIATVLSDQAPDYKFGGVNALLGGVDALAVGPTGDVYVVYGADVSGSGAGNQLFVDRFRPGPHRTLELREEHVVSGAASAALPAIAVTQDSTVGVLYDTFDGFTSDGLPAFTVHLALGRNRGRLFTDVVLEEFLTPPTFEGRPNDDPRQRVLGDFQQLKAVRGTLYGAFAGNRAPFGGVFSQIDPIFFTAER